MEYKFFFSAKKKIDVMRTQSAEKSLTNGKTWNRSVYKSIRMIFTFYDHGSQFSKLLIDSTDPTPLKFQSFFLAVVGMYGFSSPILGITPVIFQITISQRGISKERRDLYYHGTEQQLQRNGHTGQRTYWRGSTLDSDGSLPRKIHFALIGE